jgi:hypothetical protein
MEYNPRNKATRKIHRPNNKNLDNLKLLSTYKPFKETIRAIRKHLNIPENGFSTRELGEIWQIDVLSEAEETMSLADFMLEEIEEIQGIPRDPARPKESYEKFQKRYAKIPFNFINHAIMEIIKEFNLPKSYEKDIKHFIINNVISCSDSSSYHVSSSEKCVSVDIYAKPSAEDFEKIKKEIKLHGKNLPSFRNLDNLGRNLEIEKLRNEGELDPVSYKKERLKPEDIAERFLGNPKKGKEIEKITATLKKTRKNRFGNK